MNHSNRIILSAINITFKTNSSRVDLFSVRIIKVWNRLSDKIVGLIASRISSFYYKLVNTYLLFALIEKH